MPKANRAQLIERIVELRNSSRSPAEASRFGSLSLAELKLIVERLERVAAIVKMRRKPAKEGPERDALLKRQAQALERFKALAEQIRRQREESAGASQSRALHPFVEDSRPQLTSAQFEEVLNQALARIEGFPTEAFRGHIHLLDNLSRSQNLSAAANLIEYIGRSDPTDILRLAAASLTTDDVRASLLDLDVASYIDLTVQRTNWEILRVAIDHLVLEPKLTASLKRLKHLTELRTPFEPVLHSHVRPRLNAFAATEAIAKMTVLCKNFRPTRIIAAGSGSEMIGDFIASELKIAPRNRARIALGAKTRTGFAQTASALGSGDRVIVICDMASSAQDLENLGTMISERVGVDHVAFLALAGDAKTYQTLRQRSVVYFAHLTRAPSVKLPWSRHWKYRSTRAHHIFVSTGEQADIKIPKDLFALVMNAVEAETK